MKQFDSLIKHKARDWEGLPNKEKKGAEKRKADKFLF
jgi:hypothetical protein